MYGSPQAGLLAQEQLIETLKEPGYHQNKLVPGLCQRNTRPITSTLIADDFGANNTNKKDAEQLMSVLKKHYTITENWKGKSYTGMHIQRDYNIKQVHVAMPGYVEKALK